MSDPFVIPASSLGGYNVSNSCLFNGSNQYAHRSPSETGITVKGNFSAWIKFGDQTTTMALFGGFDNSGANDNDGYIVFKRLDSGELVFEGGDNVFLKTNQTFRDTTSWYHIVLAIDSSQNGNNSQRIYVNGTEITSFATRNNLTNLQDLPINSTAGNDDKILIGADEDTGGVGLFFNGYMAEVYWIDNNSQVDADDFGETNADGIWIPKSDDIIAQNFDFGSKNSFKLQFKQTGTGADSSGIGADTSGLDNHLTVVNLGANSPSLDVPTNNFMTMQPALNTALSIGNLRGLTTRTGYWDASFGTFGVQRGKWYYEMRASLADDTFRVIGGFVASPEEFTIGFSGLGATGDPLSTFNQTTQVFYGKGVWLEHWYEHNDDDNSTASAQSNNDILQFALNLDDRKMWVGINGTWKANNNDTVSVANLLAGNSPTVTIPASAAVIDGLPATSLKSWYPAFWLRDDQDADDNQADMCFGGAVSFNISSAKSDSRGFGKFEYEPPLGFLSLCTKNLADFG